MKILLVEDDFKLGQATKRLFEYEHCAVDWAQDGAEALKLLESSLECAYDVIVLNWMLPEINGLSLCRLMRNKYGYQGGIIFVTAKGEVDDCVQALDTGADDFVFVCRAVGIRPRKIGDYCGHQRRNPTNERYG